MLCDDVALCVLDCILSKGSVFGHKKTKLQQTTKDSETGKAWKSYRKIVFHFQQQPSGTNCSENGTDHSLSKHLCEHLSPNIRAGEAAFAGSSLHSPKRRLYLELHHYGCPLQRKTDEIIQCEQDNVMSSLFKQYSGDWNILMIVFQSKSVVASQVSACCEKHATKDELRSISLQALRLCMVVPTKYRHQAGHFDVLRPAIACGQS